MGHAGRDRDDPAADRGQGRDALRGPGARRPIPAEPGATTTNSSPPIRPTVSTSRTDSASTAATWRSTSSPASLPPSRFVARKSSTSNMTNETSSPARPARAISSSRTRPTVRSLAMPVRGSVCAIRSNHSDRSAAVDPRRERSMAMAASDASAWSVSRSLASSDVRRGPAQAHRAERDIDAAAGHEEGQVGADERRAVRPRRLAIERGDSARGGGRRSRAPGRGPRSPGGPPAPASIPTTAAGCESGPVGILDEHRAHRSAGARPRPRPGWRRGWHRGRRCARSTRSRRRGRCAGRWSGGRSTRGDSCTRLLTEAASYTPTRRTQPVTGRTSQR